MAGRVAGRGDGGFDVTITILLLAILLVTVYPIYFVLVASVSEPDAVHGGAVLFRPVGFTLEGYAQVMKDARIWRGYRNSTIYTVTGTSLAVLTTAMAGYALSRKELVGRGVIAKAMVFTMIFSGGLIPSYLTVRMLGLVNNPAVVVILGMVSVYKILITRAYYESSIPSELYEAAYMDGCGDARFFFRVALPVSTPILAVMGIYYGAAYWNSFLIPLIYLSDAEYYPLQIILRDILIANETLAASADTMDLDPLERIELERAAELVKLAVIVVASVPLILVYPVVQRHFVQGVMIGSLKG